MQSAFGIGLLLLDIDNKPEKILSKTDIFTSIAGISYLGDSRMGIAENPNKIKNIVLGKGNIERFTNLYSKFFPMYLEQIEDDKYRLKSNPAPYRIPFHLEKSIDMTNHRSRKDQLTQIISKKNFHSSLNQTIKGIITLGMIQSIRYAASKITKRIIN